jgi:hypothetical protein
MAIVSIAVVGLVGPAALRHIPTTAVLTMAMLTVAIARQLLLYV